jgi:tetrahydrodipicolinate N-succinyltransferase
VLPIGDGVGGSGVDVTVGGGKGVFVGRGVFVAAGVLVGAGVAVALNDPAPHAKTNKAASKKNKIFVSVLLYFMVLSFFENDVNNYAIHIRRFSN